MSRSLNVCVVSGYLGGEQGPLVDESCWGLGIERDLHWTPVPLSEVQKKAPPASVWNDYQEQADMETRYNNGRTVELRPDETGGYEVWKWDAGDSNPTMHHFNHYEAADAYATTLMESVVPRHAPFEATWTELREEGAHGQVVNGEVTP